MCDYTSAYIQSVHDNNSPSLRHSVCKVYIARARTSALPFSNYTYTHTYYQHKIVVPVHYSTDTTHCELYNLHVPIYVNLKVPR